MSLDEFREPTRRDRKIRDFSYRQALQGVFDAKTIEAIEKLISSGVIEDIYYPISTGKEADVYYARSPKGEELAVKIYRVHTSAFKRIDLYVIDDKRFEGDDLGVKMVFPNPLNPKRYVVLFSGTTWRGVYQIVGRFEDLDKQR